MYALKTLLNFISLLISYTSGDQTKAVPVLGDCSASLLCLGSCYVVLAGLEIAI